MMTEAVRQQVVNTITENDRRKHMVILKQLDPRVGRTCFTTFPWDPSKVRNSVRVLAGLGDGRYKMQVLVRAGVELPEPVEMVSTLIEVLHS